MRPSLALLLLALAASPSPAATAGPIAGEISITTSSPQALPFFLKGREKALNFQNPEAQENFKKALALDANFALALAWEGKVTPGDEGLKSAERAAELAKSLPEPERLSVEAILAERRGEDEKVRSLKRQIADLAPQDWLAQYSLGVQSFYDHKSQATILYLNRAIKLNPKAAEAYNYLGYVLAEQGQYDEGIAAVKKFTELKPDEPNAWDSFGEVLLLAGRYDAAEGAFKKATDISPDIWMAWMGVAYARFFRADWTSGREAAEKSLKWVVRQPDRLAVEVVLAWSHLCEGHGELALKQVDAIEKEALQKKLDFQYAWAAFERAEVASILGKNDEASKQLEAAAMRAQKGKLTGAEQNRLRRGAIMLQTMIASRQGNVAGAQKGLSQLEDELAKAPSNADLRGQLHFARGLLSLAQGNAKDAAQQLAKCPQEAYQCRLARASALERAGDHAGAEEVKKRLLASSFRDNLHLGEDPVYLLVRSQLTGTAPNG